VSKEENIDGNFDICLILGLTPENTEKVNKAKELLENLFKQSKIDENALKSSLKYIKQFKK
jgi:hypothetical protein